MPVKHCIVTALNERPAISRVMLNCAKRLKIDVIAACHNDKDAELVREYGQEVVIVKQNNPSYKFNIALFAAIASQKNYSHFITMGDDDTISDVFTLYPEHDYVGFADNYYIDTETGKCGIHDYRKLVPYPKAIGAGRVLSRKAIYDSAYCTDVRVIREHKDEYCTFTIGNNMRMRKSVAQMFERMGFVRIVEDEYIGLWPEAKHGLDYRSDLRLIRSGFIPHIIESDRIHVVDVKSSRNIWSFGILENKMEQASIEDAFWFMDQSEKEYIQSLISK